ncbi:MAG: serine O-acetyltransferase EpsC [Balneolales bacterium]
MDKEFLGNLFKEHQKADRCPPPKHVIDFFNNLLGFLFPQWGNVRFDDKENFDSHYRELKEELLEILSDRYDCNNNDEQTLADGFLKALPSIKDSLILDVQAMFSGDPAAKSLTEIIKTYPGFYAIASYRIAHRLHQDGLELVARIIAENAHSRTGIEIHPGAQIGTNFCIDHGTGVVIGETTRIGDYVKLYQGVTLGAMSVRKEDAATKRHPDIGDNVVIYAGASILGGNTVVGHDSVIGGNVWLTQSLPPHSRVYYKAAPENIPD